MDQTANRRLTTKQQTEDRAYSKPRCEQIFFSTHEVESFVRREFDVVRKCDIIMHLSMLCPRGGPRDRVGTLIRNENLESNFLTLGIRFQFKVPHLGEGFEFKISLETENFKPSDHEVKNMCLHLTTLSMIVLLH